MKMSSRTGCPYRDMLDRLALEDRNWQPTSTLIPKKLDVVDLDVVPKA